MRIRLLAVNPISTNYLSDYDVDVVHSFDKAKAMIILAEANNNPYDELDLPVHHKSQFWKFVRWMEKTNRKYSFSIFGARNERQFSKIAQKVRSKGFHFNS